MLNRIGLRIKIIAFIFPVLLSALVVFRLPEQFKDAAFRKVKFAIGSTNTIVPELDVIEELLTPIRPIPATGPLRIHPTNPRYFADGAGRPILLTGSHTWANLQDMGSGNPPSDFDYIEYLAFLEEYNHNFFRLWAWEQPRWTVQLSDDEYRFTPMPYMRTGPGIALDGEAKFDLTQFNQQYFDRMRERIIAAGERGIYVSIMLFDGWSVSSAKAQFNYENPWHGHPFNQSNNINGIDGDINEDDSGEETHELTITAVTRLQEAYVQKVIDTVNDLDNVLYEISNESHANSIDWQYYMINFIKDYEATKPKQHPVGMTAPFPEGDNKTLFNSPSDWISPNNARYRSLLSGHWGNFDSPIAGDGSKVILYDTDHLCGICGDHIWLWKSFTQGLNPIFMDPFSHPDFGVGSIDFETENIKLELLRRNMGYILTYANRIDLVAMEPSGDLCSTGYCLAKPIADHAEYLVFLPNSTEVVVDLSDASGQLEVEWFNPRTGGIIAGVFINGGEQYLFHSPFMEESILYIYQDK